MTTRTLTNNFLLVFSLKMSQSVILITLSVHWRQTRNSERRLNITRDDSKKKYAFGVYTVGRRS